MKNESFTLPIILLFSIFLTGSCYTIEYLGESYAPSEQVEVYYDAKQVKKEYRIIGRMAELTSVVKHTEKQMIKKAKSVGADAIIFTDMDAKGYGKDGIGTTLKAEVIRYQK